jgi:anti-sigma-K factor RskA
VLAGADTLAVTIEPAGGSPTGAPTGPIVYAGKFTL